MALYLNAQRDRHEWVALPKSGVKRPKATVDTRTSTLVLQVFFAQSLKEVAVHNLHFGLHPKQKNTEIEKIGERYVIDSGGYTELRFVNKALVAIGPIQRDAMRLRLLLGLQSGMVCIRLIRQSLIRQTKLLYRETLLYSQAFFDYARLFNLRANS